MSAHAHTLTHTYTHLILLPRLHPESPSFSLMATVMRTSSTGTSEPHPATPSLCQCSWKRDFFHGDQKIPGTGQTVAKPLELYPGRNLFVYTLQKLGRKVPSVGL